MTVAHIGDRNGPSHLRLLCALVVRWPYGFPPLGGPDFEALGSDDDMASKLVLKKASTASGPEADDQTKR